MSEKDPTNANRILVAGLATLALSASAQASGASHATIAVRSLNGQIVKVVRWRMGDPRIRPTVAYNPNRRRTSAFGAGVPDAVAAMNADFFM